MTLYVVALGLCLAAALVPGAGRVAAWIAGLLTASGGALAAVAGGLALAGHGWQTWLPDLLPPVGVRLALDPLGGLFVAVTGGVAACAAVYGIGRSGRVVPLFVAAMLLVPAAASVGTFLACWELMAITSLALVLTEHRERGAVRDAGLWYAILTQLGLVAVLCGLLLLGHDGFDQLRAADLPPAVRNAAFLATLVGFAAKAGIVPLHVWLPRAYPEAPAPAAALMSGAMVNMGVYGLLRVGLDLLGGGPEWWWLVVLGLGALSALYGILQAAVASDLQRLLGYSSTENMGLVLMGIGTAGLLPGSPAGRLALAAALLHVVNHAAFKTLLFQAAGSVTRTTGGRNLDAMGGLRTRMPYTTAIFAVGALCASALPPGNGFTSEWLLLQSLLHALPGSGVAVAVTMPLAVGVFALSAGLAVATFVKAFGVGFLARPRSQAAELATESPPTMLAGMTLAAAACVFLALNPGLVLSALPGAHPVGGLVTLELAGLTGSISPLLLAVAIAVAAAGVLAALRKTGRVRRAARLWDCGAGPMSARMEYTATSFCEPLQRVFDHTLAPEGGVDVRSAKESAYLVERVEFRASVPDRVERTLYGPVLAAARAAGERARRLADGSVHRYLGYGFYALTGALIVLAVLA